MEAKKILEAILEDKLVSVFDILPLALAVGVCQKNRRERLGNREYGSDA